jgi:cathepsin D
MGMAFQSISVFNASPPFQTLVSQNKDISSIFGFKLASSDSELFLGGVNGDLYTGNITWVNLTHKVFQSALIKLRVTG